MPIELGSVSIGAIGGAAIGAFIGHYLTKSRNTEARKIEAATDFRHAFTPILAAIDALKMGDDDVIVSLLTKNVTAHQEALLKFKFFLSESNKSEIKKAWDEYCYFEKTFNGPDPKDHPFVKYSLGYWYLADSREDDFKAKKQLAIDNINRLLLFAKLK